MLTALDNITIIIGVIVLFMIGKFFSKTSQDMDSFYQANKALPWSLAVGTLVASWYGGAGVIGTIGYTTSMGISAFFIWSISCHLTRFPLALWVAPRISVKVNTTMTELIGRYYGRAAKYLGAIVLVVSCLSIAEIAATGYVGMAAWNVNKLIVAGVVVLIATLITCLGGLMGVAVTDMIFFGLMITCVASVFPTVFFGIGGFEGIERVLSVEAPSMLTPMGGTPIGRALCLIILCVNVYKDPAFYQRFTASNSAKTGKRAMLMCFSIWMSFDVVLIFTGIILRTMDPALTVQPEVAYVQLILSHLPVVVRGMFIFGLMGAIISTIDSYFLIGGEIVARDIISPLRKTPLNDRQSINVTRVCCILFGAVGLFTAFKFPLVYDAFLFINSLSMCGLFVPVLVAVMSNGRKTPVAGLASMIFGAGSWIYFTYFPVSLEALGGQVDALLIALPISFIAFLIGNRFGEEQYQDNQISV
ncbi:MAG: sodium:solute symporter [Candidatus Fimivivens sp.]